MKIIDRKTAVSKMTDEALIHYENELQIIKKNLERDLKIYEEEIKKRANKIIRKNNPKNKIE